MKITAIKQQQKRQNRYSIFVDDSYAFSLGEDDLIRFGLHKDQEVTESELERFKQDSLIGKAYDRSIAYIALRPRSKWEVEDYFKRKSYDEAVIAEVMKKLKKLDLIDDERFAHSWVESRLAVKPRSKKQLHVELLKKHIDRDLIEEVLAHIDDGQELKQLIQLVERKSKITRYQHNPQKLIAYLARQGYSYDLIKTALAEINHAD